jgi:hemin uptake protein HemP
MHFETSTPQYNTTPSPTQTPKTIDSNELLQGHKQIYIQHGQSTYLLRVTRENKLILTK